MPVPASSEGAVGGSEGIAVVGTTQIARMTQWGFNPTASKSEWGDSDSAGFTNAKTARKAGTGTIEGKLEETQKPHKSLFKNGDTVKLVLWENTSDYWYLGRAHIDSYNLVFNQDTKEVVGWTADFTADGRYYAPGESGQPTESYPS